MYEAITVVAVHEDKMDKFLEETKPIAEAIRKQDGCINYNVFIPHERDGQVVIFESWETEEQFKEHVKSAYQEDDPLYNLAVTHKPLWAGAPVGYSGNVVL